MFAVTEAIADRAALDVRPAILGVPGLHGRSYSKYGLGQSLVALPFYLVGKATAALLPPSYRLQALSLACSLLNSVLLAALAALLPLLARRLGLASGPALWLALLAALATPLWPYAGTFFSEPLITLCLVVALLGVWPRSAAPTGPGRTAAGPLMAGLALGLAALTRLDSLLYAPPVLAAAWAWAPPGRRRGAVTLLALPVLGALAAIGWYNAARFGSPLQSGYGRGALGEAMDLVTQRSWPSVAEGAWNLLASPGKGLIFYAPLTLLAPWGAWRLWRAGHGGAVALLGALCLTDWLAHANVLIRWLGGWAWGPRFLVPIVPLLVLLAGGLLVGPRRPRGARPAVAVLALAGLLVQVPAVLADYHPYLDALAQRYSQGPHDAQAPYRAEQAYVPSVTLSPIVGQWRLALDRRTWQAQKDWGHRSPLAIGAGRAYGPPVPRTWWATLASEGVPWTVWAWPLAALTLFGSGGTALLLWPTKRQHRSDAVSALHHGY